VGQGRVGGPGHAAAVVGIEGEVEKEEAGTTFGV